MARLRTWWHVRSGSLRWYRGLTALVLFGWLALGATALAVYSLLRAWFSGWIPSRWFSGNVEDWFFGAGVAGDAGNYFVFVLAGSVALGCFATIRWAFLGESKSQESDNLASGKTVPIARNRMFGTNRIKKHIGSGGSSEVYLGESATGQQVAVKVLGGRLGQPTEAAEAIRREYEVLLQLRSGGVANLVSQGLDDASPWIATEYVEGLSLSEYIEVHGPMDHVAARALLYRLAGILLELQEQGAAHRDLSPNNVILGRQGPVLVDFGLGRIDLEHPVTGSHLIHGTPGYTAPEAVKGEAVGIQADIYALSQIQNFVLSGERPTFPHTTPLDGVENEGLQRAAAEDPRHRPNASELVEILRCDTAGVYEQWFEERELPQLPRRIPPSSLAVAAIVPVVATVGIGWMFWPEARETNEAAPPASSEEILTFLDSTASVFTVGYEVASGNFSSLPQPFGWSYESVDPWRAYSEYVQPGRSTDRVLEAHVFFDERPGSENLFVVSSVESSPYTAQPEPVANSVAVLSDSDPFHNSAFSGVEALDNAAGAACTMETPSTLMVKGPLHYFIAGNGHRTCAAEIDDFRLYIAVFEEGSNYRSEVIARSTAPLSPSLIIGQLKLPQGLRPKQLNASQVDHEFWALAGWQSNQILQEHFKQDGYAYASAAIPMAPHSQLLWESTAADSSIYEFRLLVEEGPIPAGQWIPAYLPSQSSHEAAVLDQPRMVIANPFDAPAVLLVLVEESRDFGNSPPVGPSARVSYEALPSDIDAKENAEQFLFALPWLGELFEQLVVSEYEAVTLETFAQPRGESLMVLPAFVPNYEELMAVFGKIIDKSETFGPLEFAFPLSAFPQYRAGVIDESQFYEGSRQRSEVSRPHPLSSALRLYEGDATTLEGGGSVEQWLTPQRFKFCRDTGGWKFSNTSKTHSLVVAAYMDCEVAHQGAIRRTLSPYLRFAFQEEVEGSADPSYPILIGDLVFADTMDISWLQYLMQPFLEYMTYANQNSLDPADIVLEACSDLFLAVELIDSGADSSVTDEIAIMAIVKSQKAAALDPSLRDIATLIEDFQLKLIMQQIMSDDLFMIYYQELVDQCRKVEQTQ